MEHLDVPHEPLRRHHSYPNTIREEEEYVETSVPNDLGVVDETAGRFKIIVVGDEQCGKTSLLYSFARKNYESEHPVVFEEDISTIRFGTKMVDLVLWDLSGCTHYDGFRCELYKDTDLFIVCFDIGNPQSLENVEEIWFPEILREEPRTPFILVGCKNDLRTEYDATSAFDDISEDMSEDAVAYTSVTRKSAEKIGNDWGGREYIECCARTGYHTSEVFRAAAQLLLSPADEKSSGFKGLSRFGRRKSSGTINKKDITGLFADKNFLSSSRSNSRRKSTDLDEVFLSDQSRRSLTDSRFLNLPLPSYNKHARRSSAFA